MGSITILTITFLLLKMGMLNLYQIKAEIVCYTNMKIICKLANLHIYEYVHYSNFVVKYQIILILFFFIINACVLNSFRKFIMIKYHFQLTEICFGQCLYPWLQYNNDQNNIWQDCIDGYMFKISYLREHDLA